MQPEEVQTIKKYVQDFFNANPFRKALCIMLVLIWVLFAVPVYGWGDIFIMWMFTFFTLAGFAIFFAVASYQIEEKKNEVKRQREWLERRLGQRSPF